MKKSIINILKIILIVLVALWLGVFTFDYFRAQNNQKPLVCLSEQTINLSEGDYYVCKGLGYKYYE